MKNYFIFVIMFLLSLSAISCKKDNNPINNTDINPNKIFPLSVGNQWIVQVTNYDTTGAVHYTQIDTITILRDTTIQSEKWFIGYGIMTNRNDGLYDYQASTSSVISLRYKFPTTVNSNYLYRGSQTKVISISDSITVQAGNYICYHYRVGFDGISYSDEYFSPNVGLIKIDAYNPLSGGRVYKYLSYSLIKAIIK